MFHSYQNQNLVFHKQFICFYVPLNFRPKLNVDNTVSVFRIICHLILGSPLKCNHFLCWGLSSSPRSPFYIDGYAQLISFFIVLNWFEGPFHLCVPTTPKRILWQNSEDPDEMPHNAVAGILSGSALFDFQRCDIILKL